MDGRTVSLATPNAIENRRRRFEAALAKKGQLALAPRGGVDAAAAAERRSLATRQENRRSLRHRAAKSFACGAGEASSAQRWRGRSPTQAVSPAVVGEADEGRELVPPASALTGRTSSGRH